MSKYVEINKEVWIPDIKKNIANWEEFSQSVFCENPADKQDALNRANDLRKFLALVETGTLTSEAFTYYSCKYFW